MIRLGALAIALLVGWGAHAQELFPLQAIGVTRTDGINDGMTTGGYSDRQLVVNPIPTGGAVFGATLHEACPTTFVGWCTAGVTGDLDHVNVGDQQAIILGTVQDPRCQNTSACGAFVSGIGSGGFALTIWWLPNVQGNPTTIDVVASPGGQMSYAGSVASVFTGIPSNATVDAANGAGYAPTGAWNGPCCGGGVLTSFPVTPTQSGDFLYGANALYGCGPSSADTGAGWIGSNVDTAFYSKADEWQVYNSTAPIGATFSTSCSDNVAWAATVAVKMGN